MTVTSLCFVDPATVDTDSDTWIESCTHCGTFDNRGDHFCLACEDIAA